MVFSAACSDLPLSVAPYFKASGFLFSHATFSEISSDSCGRTSLCLGSIVTVAPCILNIPSSIQLYPLKAMPSFYRFPASFQSCLLDTCWLDRRNEMRLQTDEQCNSLVTVGIGLPLLVPLYHSRGFVPLAHLSALIARWLRCRV